METKQGNDHRLDLMLSLVQERIMTQPEASASVSQGIEAVDSPETQAASFSGRPQGPLQRLLPQNEGQGGGNVFQRGHCNTNEELEMVTIMEHFHHMSSKRQLDSIQWMPTFHSYITLKELNTESHKPVHNCSDRAGLCTRAYR